MKKKTTPPRKTKTKQTRTAPSPIAGLSPIQYTNDCDKVVGSTLTACDFRGGIPKWTSGSPGNLDAACSVASEYETDFSRWNKDNFGLCKKFKKQGKNLTTVAPSMPSNLINQIKNVRVQIKRRLGELGDKGQPYQHVFEFLEKKLNTESKSIRYNLLNPSMTVDYRWFNPQELQRLLSQLKALLSIVQNIQF